MYRCKLAVSAVAVMLLDAGLALYLSGSYSLSGLWEQAVAFHLLNLCIVVLFLAAHVQVGRRGLAQAVCMPGVHALPGVA
jgi:thiosulfate reductase cytochrome b subunit